MKHRVYLNRVRIDRQGYDSSGRYWGLGPPLFNYSGDRGDIGGTIRAADRDAAKAQIVATHPELTLSFFR